VARLAIQHEHAGKDFSLSDWRRVALQAIFAPMITVATCNDPMHAQLLKSVLEDSDIQVLIPNEHSAQTMPHLILAMGGIRLQVRQEDEETAKQLIAEFNAAAPGSDTFPPTIT